MLTSYILISFQAMSDTYSLFPETKQQFIKLDECGNMELIRKGYVGLVTSIKYKPLDLTATYATFPETQIDSEKSGVLQEPSNVGLCGSEIEIILMQSNDVT